MLEFVAILATSYLIGGIPFGYIVARRQGVNILVRGSGNIGATNVGRVLGPRYGVLVFILDFAKGVLPVVGAMLVQEKYPIDVTRWLRPGDWLPPGLVEVCAGLMAFVGHLLPIYLRFRGGKGVATGAGVVAVLAPGPALAALGCWILLTAATRYVSIASMGAVIVLCICQLGMTSFDLTNPRTWFCLTGAALVLIRHQKNLLQLLAGTENRIPFTPMLERLAKALHVLALGFWFGSSIFFTFVVTPILFDHLESLRDPDKRPDWLPLPAKYVKSDDFVDGPKEQTIRLAGSMVGAIFPMYFLLQLICGLVATVPALVWWRRRTGEKIHRWRAWLLLLALLLVGAGIWLELVVHDLQLPRHTAVDVYLEKQKSLSATDTTVLEMKASRRRFGMWHGVSVLTNYATIALVSTAMILTVLLPSSSRGAARAAAPVTGIQPAKPKE